jgi:hypothetical protein
MAVVNHLIPVWTRQIHGDILIPVAYQMKKDIETVLLQPVS